MERRVLLFGRMTDLTGPAKALCHLLQQHGRLGPEQAAEQLGLTRGQVAQAKEALKAKGLIVLGKGGSMQVAGGQEAHRPPSRMRHPPMVRCTARLRQAGAERKGPQANGHGPMNEQAFLKDLDKKLWTAADRLRSDLAVAVSKYVMLGLAFL